MKPKKLKEKEKTSKSKVNSKSFLMMLIRRLKLSHNKHRSLLNMKPLCRQQWMLNYIPSNQICEKRNLTKLAHYSVLKLSHHYKNYKHSQSSKNLSLNLLIRNLNQKEGIVSLNMIIRHMIKQKVMETSMGY